MTYALIDNMSDTSFISLDLVEKMNLPPTANCKPRKITLNTLNHISTTEAYDIKGLKVRGYGNPGNYLTKLPTMVTTQTNDYK